MYIYNVTVKIDQSRADEWLVWMREKHIPDVMATGFFTENRICRLVDEGDMEGITFAIHSEKFGTDFVAFRTLMEVV